MSSLHRSRLRRPWGSPLPAGDLSPSSAPYRADSRPNSLYSSLHSQPQILHPIFYRTEKPVSRQLAIILFSVSRLYLNQFPIPRLQQHLPQPLLLTLGKFPPIPFFNNSLPVFFPLLAFKALDFPP